MSGLGKEIIDALNFFGPLNFDQIKEKLKLRGYNFSNKQIEIELVLLVGGKHIKEATGFDEVTYKKA